MGKNIDILFFCKNNISLFNLDYADIRFTFSIFLNARSHCFDFIQKQVYLNDSVK